LLHGSQALEPALRHTVARLTVTESALPMAPYAPGGALRTLEHDGLVEVDFGRHGTTLVDPD
jgi:hypothetical protein